MSLLWNDKVKHLLPQNFNLAKKILVLNIKKFSENASKLNMINDTILELNQTGIIEKIRNIEKFIAENSTCSFWASMPVFKLSKEMTKFRFVFLSNLSEKSTNSLGSISHNKAMYSGPCQTQKMTCTLMLLRFDKNLLCFDLKKAFCQIEENETEKVTIFIHETSSNVEYF